MQYILSPEIYNAKVFVILEIGDFIPKQDRRPNYISFPKILKIMMIPRNIPKNIKVVKLSTRTTIRVCFLFLFIRQ